MQFILGGLSPPCFLGAVYMNPLESVDKSFRWAYKKSFFYRQIYNKQGILVKDSMTRADFMQLPIISLLDYISAPLLDVVSLPLSSVSEISSATYGESMFLKARSDKEISDSVELTKKYLVSTGVNRTSIVALDGLSAVEGTEISMALSAIGAGVCYLTTEMSFAEKLNLLGRVGADTIIIHVDSLHEYIITDRVSILSRLFRIVAVSYTYPKNEKKQCISEYEATIGTPIYEIISLPWTASLIDLYKSVGSDDYIARNTLLVENISDDPIFTDTAARAMPLIRVKQDG